MKRQLNPILLILAFILVFNSAEARIYFMHVPKTGGTTLRLLLELQLSSQEIYPYRNPKTSKSPPIQEDLVSGHFPYWFCKNMDDRFEEAFKVTVLRDPVERYLSFLRSKKKANNHLHDLESVLKLRLVPNGKYQEGLVDNALCRYLSADPQLEGKALLESAKQALKEFDSVIFFDRFREDVMDLFARLGINLDPQDILKINSTEPEPISEELLNEVRNINELDIQLYEYAKKHLHKKYTQYPLRTDSYDAILKPTSVVDYTFDLPLCGRGWTYRDIWNDKTIKYPIYRWVTNHPASICFSLNQSSNYELLFNAQTLCDGVIPQVSINGKEIKITRLNNEPFSLYHGLIPKEYITHDSTEITFYSEHAFQYRDFYPSQHNRNHPPLSFAINRIRITPS